MKRHLDSYLRHWRAEDDRKVLLVRGARQVGKTYCVRGLGAEFEHFLEVNFEQEKPVSRFFEGSLDPVEICAKLEAYFDVAIVPGETLLFFDEIQACPQALRSLRFFYEKMSNLHVVAAGSLLEFALAEIPSFGVGRISHRFLYPMTLAEFLDECGGRALNEMVRKASFDAPLDEALHEKLLEKISVFLLIGGMPAVVEAYRAGRGLRYCQSIIDELLTSLRDDFAKYSRNALLTRMDEVLLSVAGQAGGKFKYSNVPTEGAHRSCKDALSLLEKAHLVHRVYHTSARGLPLGAQANLKKFKVLPFDVGIYQRLLGLGLSEHLVSDPSDLVNRGAIAEVFVGLELLAHYPPHTRRQLHYWHREARASNAEVDYVIQQHGTIVPIEVKAGTRGQMQSMHIFLNDRNLPAGIRISHENFGTYDKIRTLPIYAIEHLCESGR